ncbi:hypothetical protein INT47_008632 [Mucor saturninus]|uniref:Bromo domain-containing protein n=1 Tax=Mucor saturninus TaxID=64648 RepID=A0A8H7QTK2_9FUNG|nr:hypothetical protein INT47_008632 [Mucor saturninus]
MPTTRLTAGKSPMESSTVMKESSLESRKEIFEAKKKREALLDPTPKQRIMVQFLEAILNVDKRYLLWTPRHENAITFDIIEDRVYKGKYKDINALKSDFDELLLTILPFTRSSHTDMDAFKELYAFAENSLRFESKRLNQPITESETLYQLSALFRPTPDGYAFTDMTLKNSSAGPLTNLPSNVQEIIIHPAPPAREEEVPSLKQVVAPPPKYFAKTLKHEDKPILPIQWLDFGAFSSFAPASDSNNANATYEHTYMGRSAKRHKRQENQPKSTTSSMEKESDTEINASWLAQQGLDINVIEAAMDKAPENVNEELERNSELLEELVNYQKTRFTDGKESDWKAVNEKEIEIAKILESNMTSMLARLPPNATTNNDVIEKTMERLPMFESAYRGTLPPHKIFSFPTTEKAENLPPYANITPTYSKDNWRLVKVSPLPPKDLKDTHGPPLVSMLEQQQLNFFSKPPFPPPLPQQQQQRVPTPGQPFAFQQRR